MLAHVRRHAVAYLALAVALGSAGTYAATTFVGSDGTITGCVKPSGVLRVVAAGKSCAKNERRLRFNQRGIQGATGAPGAAGAAGQPGAPGDKGDRGTTMVARIRSTAETNLQYSPDTTVLPLTGVEWSQPPGEVDVAYGSVTHVESGNCGTASPVVLSIKDNGATIGTASWVAITPVPITQQIVFATNPVLPDPLFDPDTTKGHSITATVASPCSGGTQTVKSIKVDIVGLR